MGLSQNYRREDETLARKRLELVIVGAPVASLSRAHPIASARASDRTGIQSLGEILLLIRCRCSDGGSTIRFMVGENRDSVRASKAISQGGPLQLSAAARAACQ